MADISISLNDERFRKLKEFCDRHRVAPQTFVQDFVNTMVDRKLDGHGDNAGQGDDLMAIVQEQSALLKQILGKLS